jgi:hypothetical protein
MILVPPPPRTLAGVAAMMAATRIQTRSEAVEVAITYEQIADGHIPQLDLMVHAGEQDPNRPGFLNRHVIAICSRRAAKSTGICGLLAMDASQFDGAQIYFGKTKPAVRFSIWNKIWKPFCKKMGFQVSHAEGPMVSTFSSGGVVAFTGTDDIAHIETYLGNKLRRAVLDEVQSQPASILEPLVDRILPPALSDTGGQLLLAGTIPEVPAGLFYQIWSTGEGWKKFSWSRFDNPHMGTVEHQMERLNEYLTASKRKITDPLVQRDWFGKFIFDLNATAYAYDAARNAYHPEEPEWLEPFLQQYVGDPNFDHFHRTDSPRDGKARSGIMAAEPIEGIEVYSCAIDPGASDRFSIEVTGWGSGTQKVQHVFEFSSKRGAAIRWSQVSPLIQAIQEHYAPSWWFYDAGGSKVVLDSFVGDSSLPALMPASKSGLHGQVERVNDILIQGWLQVMAGSALEEDYQVVRWDADARSKLQWKWSTMWHPDPADSARYALGAFFETYEVPKDEKTQEEADRERHEVMVRRQKASRLGQTLEEDLVERYARVEAEEENQWD